MGRRAKRSESRSFGLLMSWWKMKKSGWGGTGRRKNEGIPMNGRVAQSDRSEGAVRG